MTSPPLRGQRTDDADEFKIREIRSWRRDRSILEGPACVEFGRRRRRGRGRWSEQRSQHRHDDRVEDNDGDDEIAPHAAGTGSDRR